MHADAPSLFSRAAQVAAEYRLKVGELPVQPSTGRVELDKAFGGPLPRDPTPAAEVVERLVAAAEPGLVATVGPRYFGFVIGGASPAASAADVLAVGWDQCAYNEVLSPSAAAAERAAGAWLKELLHLPESA
ncbi:MAG TPA: aspartate aminotransferase family protein, partial [Intrasporangium sp.]|nr:aspartate aminotransferase family protein [Intrasporangium sp.]